MNRRGHLGRQGEDLAVAWYQAHGYKVLDRNWRFGRLGEIDVVALRNGELVISEVKTRTNDRFGLPVESVTAIKQLRLRKLGAGYLSEHSELRVRRIRFDVVSVLGTKPAVPNHLKWLTRHGELRI